MKKIFTFFAAALMAGSLMATTVASWNNGTATAGDFSVKASNASKVSISYTTKYNANKTSCTAMTFASSITATNKQPTDFYVKASIEGGFKAGDTVRIAPFTVMSTNDYQGTKFANIRVYADNTVAYESTATASDKSSVTDGHEQEGDILVHEFILSADCDSLCFGRTGGTRICVLSFEVTRESSEQPGDEPGDDPVLPDSIFYSFEAYSVDTVWTDSLFDNGVHAYSAPEDAASENSYKNLMMIKSIKRSYESLSFTKALYFAGSPKSNGRIATVDVQYPATVTVYAMSSTKNADATRSLYLSEGSLSDKTAVITHTTDGTSDSQVIQKGTYDLKKAATLYFSADSGMYLFGFSVVKKATEEPGDDPEVPTAIDNTPATHKAVKAIENGQLVIIRDGVRYNITGARL